ncbi:hypothetical protein ACP70R_041100 [Stipagrostis hirtigluma subsp. patula]
MTLYPTMTVSACGGLLADRARENSRCTAMLRDVAQICTAFGDVLPVKMLDYDDTAAGGDGTGFAFIGDEARPSRVDELALALLKILADGVAHEAKRGVSLFSGPFLGPGEQGDRPGPPNFRGSWSRLLFS